MTPYVVDASVAVKWYIPEPLSAKATGLQTCGAALHAPDFLDVELAAIVWKKVRRDGLPQPDADAIMVALPTLPLTRHPTAPLVAPAFALPSQTGRTGYDCLYLALAVRLGGVMVTADERIVNGLAGTPLATCVIKLADLP